MDDDKVLEKLSTIEKIISEIADLRQRVVECRELEAERQTEIENLSAREKKYRSLLESIDQKLYIKDRNSSYISANDAYAADLKTTPAEMVGKTDFDFFPREWAEKYIADDKRIMDAGRSEHIEEPYCLEGRQAFVHTLKIPIRGEGGELPGSWGFSGILPSGRQKRKSGPKNGRSWKSFYRDGGRS